MGGRLIMKACPPPFSFARVGKNYVAVIIGGDTEPELLVKDLTGAQVDEEADAFSGMMILDCGFYGDDGQYLWTLSMDVYGTKANTVMNTFQVGKMNTGEVSLGDAITYKVLFENGRLRVFNTRQLYTYDYKGVQDTNATMLVYGWKLIDAYISAKGDAKLLMAPTAQTNTGTEISELRLLMGSVDRRYTLPSACVGAAVYDNAIYAFSETYLYKTDINTQQFYAYEIPTPDGSSVTSFSGTFVRRTGAGGLRRHRLLGDAAGIISQMRQEQARVLRFMHRKTFPGRKEVGNERC